MSNELVLLLEEEDSFTAEEVEEEEYKPPSYNTPGRILFKFDPDDGIEVLDCDGSAFWLKEGGIAEYQIEEWLLTDQEPGYFVFEKITGSVYTDYEGNHDEDWDYGNLRPAYHREVVTETLIFIKEEDD